MEETILKHIIQHSLETKAVHSAEKSAPPEIQHQITEAWESVVTGFPLYGLPVWAVVAVLVVALAAFIAWNFVGKGRGSHAGREEIRRSYRRKLAQEMARQDAAKIEAGEKPRRWWYRW